MFAHMRCFLLLRLQPAIIGDKTVVLIVVLRTVSSTNGCDGVVTASHDGDFLLRIRTTIYAMTRLTIMNRLYDVYTPCVNVVTVNGTVTA